MHPSKQQRDTSINCTVVDRNEEAQYLDKYRDLSPWQEEDCFYMIVGEL